VIIEWSIHLNTSIESFLNVYSPPRREKTRRWETSFRSLFTGQPSYLPELSGPQTLDSCRVKTQNRLREHQTLSLVGLLERMKRDSGIKDRDERSSGIEILMADAFAKIKPTDPLRLTNLWQSAWRKQNSSDSSGSSLSRADASRWVCKKSKRMKSSYIPPEVFTVNGRNTIGSGRFR
jgi:hypothetical protein